MQWVRPASPAQPLLPTPPGKGDLQPQLDSALQDVNDMYLLLEETEKQAVRRALIEERGRFCTFITFLQPVVVGPLQGIIDDLVVLTAEPHKLPPASEQVRPGDGAEEGMACPDSGTAEPGFEPSGVLHGHSGLAPLPRTVSPQKHQVLPWPGQGSVPDSTVIAQQLQFPEVQHVQVSEG